MDLLLDHFWIWIVLTFIVGIGSYAWYVNNQSGRCLILAVVLPILTFALGLALYYGVDTDRKSIARTLEALIAAVEADDVEATCRFISPKAEDVQKLAKIQMRTVRISRAKYHNLKIEVNDAASHPIAHVHFSTSFYWRTKSVMDGFSIDQSIPQSVRFEIELVQTKEQLWQLTRCRYFPLRGF